MVARHLIPEHQAQRLFIRSFCQFDDEALIFEGDVGTFRHAGGTGEKGQEEQKKSHSGILGQATVFFNLLFSYA